MRVSPEPVPATPQGFRALYREHFDFLWRSVQRLGVGVGAVDDVVQEVFLAAYRGSTNYDGRAPVRAWLFGIAVNITRMNRRGELRHRRRVEAAGQHVEPALEPASQHAAVDQLDRLLAELDDDQRSVVVSIEIEGMSPRDVAAALGVSVNTVYSRLRLARAHLQRAAIRQRAREARSA
jgi:RNA polymerase sigma-70 factor, ECF subfamily